MNNQQDTDEDILSIELCLNGEKESFAQLIEKYKIMVYNLCYRMTGSRHDAEDLSQDAFIRAYKHLKTFSIGGGTKFSTWLYTIALNLCRDKLRKRKFMFFSLDAPVKNYDALYPQIQSDDEDPNETFVAKEEKKIVQKSISSLPFKYRRVITLRHQQGLSYEEISNVLKLPLHTVKVHIHRARGKLKELFEEAGLK